MSGDDEMLDAVGKTVLLHAKQIAELQQHVDNLTELARTTHKVLSRVAAAMEDDES